MRQMAGSETQKNMLTLKIWSPGTEITVHFFRRDELMTRTLVMRPPALDTAWLEFDEDADERTCARREAWLGAPNA